MLVKPGVLMLVKPGVLMLVKPGILILVKPGVLILVKSGVLILVKPGVLILVKPGVLMRERNPPSRCSALCTVRPQRATVLLHCPGSSRLLRRTMKRYGHIPQEGLNSNSLKGV